MLPFYANRFRAVEIDSSYYGVPATRTVASMQSRTPPEFRFSFKAPQTVTHAPESAAGRVHDDARLLRETLEPLNASGKLACVLAQFPNGFRPSDKTREYLRAVAATLAGLPLVAEFRHREWQAPETLSLLRELGIGWCNVDMPRYDTLLTPSSDATSPIGYVRFHGRNAGQWWTGDNVTRYDYLYTPAELEPWTDRIAELEAQVEETYVFFNNHARGNAARNADDLEALLSGRYGPEADRVLARGRGGLPSQSSLPGLLKEGTGFRRS
jgi:uncharacterized protein YecE (DUF72 family)